jgi:hypothetical protein
MGRDAGAAEDQEAQGGRAAKLGFHGGVIGGGAVVAFVGEWNIERSLPRAVAFGTAPKGVLRTV